MRKTVPCKSTVLLFSLVLLFSSAAKAQSATFANGKVEAGIGLGPLFFLGDLGGNRGVGTRFVKDVNLPLTKFAKGVFVQYYFKEWLSARLAVNAGLLEGDDALINGKGGYEESRKIRNLNFRSKLQEAYLAFEISPTVFMEQYEGLFHKVRPYVIGGVGVFHFNPQGKYFAPDGTWKWVDLQPLRTEGQGMTEYPDRKPYNLTQVMLPIGVGVKYYLSENVFIGAEILHRKTFTDYIDDVSTNYIDANLFGQYLTPDQAAVANQVHYRQDFVPGAATTRPATVGEQRGNPKQNDSYFSSIIRMGWRFADVLDSDRRALRASRCPSYF
ncbi:DUF6089 family protein [Flaviaesturariibacter aridisoli]|uniref:Outer membrane protein beta-barrel domain-containing protein n=1 Tax=Flaviaesturariibacter aridisoli TaxID=2545761 RepID=A0A4R4DVC4_9BACT|nr:outer membrane beta-barrel protein [Flaviaesturariibacter aridisoli]TCZ67183.1 hypothetical protein E0486_16025 [Flaviaesturariibacter aridisoli]